METDLPFETLLKEANDWDLCSGTFKRIAANYGEGVVSVAAFRPEERIVMLVWHVSGIIGNGGFHYLFEDSLIGDEDFALTAEAFRLVGLDRSYQAFMQAFSLFPTGRVPEDLTVRAEQLATFDEDCRIGPINQLFWQDTFDHNVELKLAAYIRENSAALAQQASP